MRLLTLVICCFFMTYACQTPEEAVQNQVNIPAELQIASIDTVVFASSIRALEVVDDSTIWWAGSAGKFGYSEDGGESWVVDSLQWDTIQPHFRSIAVTQDAVFLLSIASPTLLFRSVDKGKNWALVYEENHPDAFYDAMAFWDNQNGIAMGDPTDGCLSVIRTKNGGETWEKLSCDQLPSTEEGEAAFAASNTNIALSGQAVWLVSGGKRARVFHSPDRGETWTVSDSPIAEGEQMTGIFSVDFYDEQRGIIFGGDWNDKALNSRNKAMSEDGGQSWIPILEGAGPGYQSCVRFVPNADAQAILSCGIPGINYSRDGGQSWTKLNDQSWYTLRFGSSWETVWLAGNGKVGKIKWKTELE